MSAEHKTQNIELNLWQGYERPQREDFVSDNVKVDEAIGGLSGGLQQLSENHNNHLNSATPHVFEDEAQKKYVYGFKQQGNRLVFVFQEVV